jgi:hypothetical protein
MSHNHPPAIKRQPVIMVSILKGNSDVRNFTVRNGFETQSGSGCSPDGYSMPHLLVHSRSGQLGVGVHRICQVTLRPDSTCTNSIYCSTTLTELQCCITGLSVLRVLKVCTAFVFKLLESRNMSDMATRGKYRAIHKSLWIFQNRLHNNQQRHGRNDVSSTCKVEQNLGVTYPLLTCSPLV